MKTKSMLTLLETKVPSQETLTSGKKTSKNIPQDTSVLRREFIANNIEIQSPFHYLKVIFDDEIINSGVQL